ncbi:hypothetical protein [Anaeromassilibacillus senegalensis]|uniref:hypothetical protein n=1 Tax=Anaeromassilibacillus senegalensis TaxID=1673717 RepID=UPI0006806D7D|nr:hypothetical protein [Anaeromassilibacillus senegalensis]
MKKYLPHLVPWACGLWVGYLVSRLADRIFATYRIDGEIALLTIFVALMVAFALGLIFGHRSGVDEGYDTGHRAGYAAGRNAGPPPFNCRHTFYPYFEEDEEKQ